MKKAKSEHFTPELIEMYRTWTPEAAANVYDERMRTIERSHAETFTEMGIILVEVEARNLWKHAVTSDGRHPRTFSAWVVDCCPVSNGSAFAALKVAKQLAEIPAEEREQIPRGNLETMSRMSSSLAKSDKVRAAAKKMKPKEFLESIERDHPEQHIESSKPMRFSPERSARKNIDLALDMAMVLEEAISRDEALEKICTLYIEENRDIYEAEIENRKQGTSLKNTRTDNAPWGVIIGEGKIQ